MRGPLWFGLALCISLLPNHSEAGGPWEEILHRDGVRVWARDEPNRALPTFKGRGTVKGSIHHLMAVILDNRRAPEWVDRCVLSREISRSNARTTVVYSRADSPWPVADRDTVVEVKTDTIKPGEEYRIYMRSIPGIRPPVDGVVRIEQSLIYFHLKRIDDGQTDVVYSLNVDPAGALPKWLVRLSTRSMPVETIRALERQVAKTEGIYETVIKALRTPQPNRHP